MASYLANDKGYGLIFGVARDIYKRADRQGVKYLVVSDGQSTGRAGVEKLVEVRQLLNDQGAGMMTDSKVLLEYFTAIHAVYIERLKKADTGTHPGSLVYTPVDVIFVELGSYVRHKIEYASLMYMCLLHLDITLPQFYLICSFPTEKFDYLEYYVFNDPTQQDVNTDEIAHAISAQRRVLDIDRISVAYRASAHSSSIHNPSVVDRVSLADRIGVDRTGVDRVSLADRTGVDRASILQRISTMDRSEDDDQIEYSLVEEEEDPIEDSLLDSGATPSSPVYGSPIEVNTFKLSTINEIANSECVVVITEDTLGWQSNLRENMTQNIITFEGFSKYYHQVEELKGKATVPIILVQTPEELLVSTTKVDMVIYDPRIKVKIDLHFLGNVRRSRDANPEWYNYNLRLIALKFPEAKLYLNKTTSTSYITRGTKERNPITDVYYFYRKQISLLELYQHYYNSATEYTHLIKSASDMLSRLGYYDRGAPELIGNLHPIFPKMKVLWDEKGYPRFAFLIVLAVIMSYSPKHIEIKKSDEEQVDRFRSVLDYYLNLMAETGNPFPDDSSGISRNLRHLCERNTIKEEEYQQYEIADIMKSLIEVIREHFSSYIITLRGGDNSYRSKHNQNMVWKLMVNETDDMIYPKELFPIVVYSSERGKKVALYIAIA